MLALSFSVGKFLDLADVAQLVQPDRLTQKVVSSWLLRHGVWDCRTVITQDFLQCAMTVE